MNDGKLIAELFESMAEEHLVNPTFITDFPVEVSPLSKQRRDDPQDAEHHRRPGREPGHETLPLPLSRARLRFGHALDGDVVGLAGAQHGHLGAGGLLLFPHARGTG